MPEVAGFLFRSCWQSGPTAGSVPQKKLLGGIVLEYDALGSAADSSFSCWLVFKLINFWTPPAALERPSTMTDPRDDRTQTCILHTKIKGRRAQMTVTRGHMITGTRQRPRHAEYRKADTCRTLGQLDSKRIKTARTVIPGKTGRVSDNDN